VENLFEYARLRKFAEELRVVSIDKTNDGYAVKLNQDARVSPEKLTEFVQETGANFRPNGILRVKTGGNPIEEARKVLMQIAETRTE
jgi:transcription-repair coupling factor (superfamily II helicase)